MPVVAQSPTPRTVTAPVTVVAPDKEAEPSSALEKDVPLVRVVQTGPVQFTLPLGVWIAWLASIATGLGAIAIIWKFVTKAAVIVTDFSNYGSVLKEIAKEFKNNSGSTLKDSIDRIEAAAALAQSNAALAKTVADNLEKTLRDHIVATKTRDEMSAAMSVAQRRENRSARQHQQE